MPWTRTGQPVVTDEGIEFEFHAGADKNGLPMYGRNILVDPEAAPPEARPEPTNAVMQAAQAAAVAELPVVDVAPAGRLLSARRAVAAKAPALAAHPKAATGTAAAVAAGAAVHFLPLLL